MGSRHGEFPNYVIEAAYRRSGAQCEDCGSKENLEAHHILALAVAAEYFPQLATQILASLENCRLLCWDCHHLKVHKENDFIVYYVQAQYLLSLQGDKLF